MQKVTIGSRLRSLRMERGLTQAELADRAGVSVDLVSKIERDAKESMSWQSMTKLARALDVDPGVIAGKKPALSPVPGAAVLTVRDAVINHSLLPGLSPDGDEPADHAAVWKQVERSYGAYFGGHFGQLAAELPSLITRARIAHTADRPAGAAALAHAWELAAELLVHTGRDDAAAIAAERAIHAAKDGEDQWRAATMYGGYSWVLLHQGRYDEAEAVAARAADDIEPSMSKAPAAQVVVWGKLMLHAAVACGGRLDVEQAEQYLAAAGAAAGRLGEDHRGHYWTSFGPSQVALQRAHILTAAQRPDAALAASEGVRKKGLYKISYGRHLLNEARCQLERRRVDEALETTAKARTISPEWFRHQGFAQALVLDIAERRARLTAPLRELLQAFEPRR